MRLCGYLEGKFFFIPIYILARLLHLHFSYKYGIWIHPDTDIAEGLRLDHFGGIIVNKRAKIGKNCNIGPGTVIGQANRGKRAGYPIIGNNVYIGPGSKIIGGITIGDNVAIGASCVVVNNIPNNAVVVGIPGKVISKQGSGGYVNNRWM